MPTAVRKKKEEMGTHEKYPGEVLIVFEKRRTKLQKAGLEPRTWAYKVEKKRKKTENGGFQSILLTSRIERSIADPKGYVVIIGYTRETNFRRPPLAELDSGARSFAGDTESGHVGRAWDGHAAAGGQVALGIPVINQTQLCRSQAT